MYCLVFFTGRVTASRVNISREKSFDAFPAGEFLSMHGSDVKS